MATGPGVVCGKRGISAHVERGQAAATARDREANGDECNSDHVTSFISRNIGDFVLSCRDFVFYFGDFVLSVRDFVLSVRDFVLDCDENEVSIS
jgi:hypothetical protein